jgi:hypothetical protein
VIYGTFQDGITVLANFVFVFISFLVNIVGKNSSSIFQVDGVGRRRADQNQPQHRQNSDTKPHRSAF